MSLISRIYGMGVKDKLYYLVVHLASVMDALVYMGSLGFFTGNFQYEVITRVVKTHSE